MGWFDKLKDYAEDAVDWVEDNVDDTEGWIKDKVHDVVGENNWASDLLDKSGVMETDLAGKAWDYVDEATDGTWAEEAFDTVDDIADEGIGGAASGLIGEHLGGTWFEDAATKASDVWDEGVEGAVGAVHGLADEHLGDTWLGDALDKADGVAGGKLSEFWEDEQNLVKPIGGAVADAVEGSWADDLSEYAGSGIGIAGGLFETRSDDLLEPADGVGSNPSTPIEQPAPDMPTMHAAVEPPTDPGMATFQIEQPAIEAVEQPIDPVADAAPAADAGFDATDSGVAPMEEQIVDDLFAPAE